jgi:hypothetical protein
LKRYIIFILSCFIFQASFSQTGTSIIFQNGDTLMDSKIYSSFKKTNSKKLTFERNGQVETVSVSDVIAYWDGKNYFSRKPIDESGECFINLLLSGPLTLGEYVSEGGKTIFVVKLEAEEKFRIINDSKANLNSYFSSFLPRYAEFMEEYKKAPVHTRKSIGEFVSAYNQFRNPEKYKFTKFKHPRKFYFGVSLLSTSNSFSTDLGSFESGNRSHIGLGINGRINVTPKLSFMGVLGKNKSEANEYSSRLVINSTFFEGHMIYSLTNSSKLNILLGSNFTILFNSNSNYYVPRATLAGVFIDSYQLESISTGYGLNLLLIYPTPSINFGAIVGVGGRSINSKQNDFTGTGYNGHSKTIRLGLMVEF